MPQEACLNGAMQLPGETGLIGEATVLILGHSVHRIHLDFRNKVVTLRCLM